MRILIFEDNLLWSARLKKTVESLGHEALVLMNVPPLLPEAQAAIVNLGSSTMEPAPLVEALKASGVYVIAHAGHKEKELQQLGRSLGCNYLASNSELTFKLGDILAHVLGKG